MKSFDTYFIFWIRLIEFNAPDVKLVLWKISGIDFDMISAILYISASIFDLQSIFFFL